jgi:hypothetical protein
MSEIQTLRARWRRKTGEDMPDNIASLPMDRIRRAVELTEKGIVVAVPKPVSNTKEEPVCSMMDFDRHKEF